MQRGLQLNERLKGDLAVFYRVYQKGGTNQTALVLLNKGNQTTRISVSDYLEPGEWRDAFTGGKQRVRDRLEVDVPAHSVRVFLLGPAPDPRRHPQAPGRTDGSQQPVRAAVRIRVKNTQIDDSATNCLGAVEIG